eukprot:scaffold316_cov351-Prasinococcus_capsulatus_cf.AAC.1
MQRRGTPRSCRSVYFCPILDQKPEKGTRGMHVSVVSPGGLVATRCTCTAPTYLAQSRCPALHA